MMSFHLPARLWADQPLRTKGLVLAALPLLILVGALVWVAGATREEEAAEARVESALRIQADLRELEALVYRAALERAEGAPTRPRLAEAERDLPALLASLDGQVRDPGQRARLAVAAPLAREALAEVRSGDMQWSVAMGALERVIAGLRGREAALLTERIRRAERARARNLAVTMAAGALGVLGSLAGVLLFSTGIVRRVRVLEANADRLARGEALAPPPLGADEVGRLGGALARASALLSDRKQRLEELVARLFQVQEDERRRVAYDLHDGVAQLAAAAHGHLQAYAERFPPAAPEAQAALDCGLGLVQRTVRETRAAIAGLRPTALDDFGLALALKLEVDALRDEGREAVFVDRLGPERPSPVIETALFRIAQEALANVRKHAGPSASVRVLLEPRADMLALEVHDDGPGFATTTEPVAAGERIGLDAMRERALLLGGRVLVESKPDQGTSVLVEIPAKPVPDRKVG